MTATRHPLTSRAAALLCAVALLTVPAAAHAQFGKLKDLGKKAAGSVVEKKVEDEATKKVAGAAGAPGAAEAGAEAKPRSVEFTEDVVEITEARLAPVSYTHLTLPTKA